MLITKYLFAALLLVVVVVLSQKAKAQEKDTFNMTAAELKTVMAEGDAWVILDVRTPQELVGQHGQIAGVINIPVQVLAENITHLQKYKKKKVAVICRSGNRSITATQIMQKNGFSARNILGGMKAYNKLK